MPPQQHLPVLRTIPFLDGNGLARLRVRPFWQKNGLAHTDTVLVYGHHGWPTASMAHLVGELTLARDGHQDGQGKKHNAPTAGYGVYSLREHKKRCKNTQKLNINLNHVHNCGRQYRTVLIISPLSSKYCTWIFLHFLPTFCPVYINHSVRANSINFYAVNS